MTQWQGYKKYAQPTNGSTAAVDPLTPKEIEDDIHQRLIRDFDESAIKGLGPERVREQVERAARTLATEHYPGLVGDEKEEILLHVIDEVTGLGPIEPLLRDPAVSELMVNAPNEVY